MSEQIKFNHTRDNVPATPKLRLKKGEQVEDAIARFTESGWQLDGIEYHVVGNEVRAGPKPAADDSQEETE